VEKAETPDEGTQAPEAVDVPPSNTEPETTEPVGTTLENEGAKAADIADNAPSDAAPTPAGFASRRGDGPPAVVPRREPAISAPMPEGPRPPVAAPAPEPTPRVAAPAAALPAAPPFGAPVPVAGTSATSDTATTDAPARSGIAAASAAAAPIGRFLSRRKSKPAPVVAPAATAATVAAPAATPKSRPQSEAERMTIFGARQSEVGGKPRFLGLVLTAALLVFLAGVAAWASVFLDDGLNLSRLFGDRSTASASSSADENTTTAPEQTQSSTEQVVTASLDTGLTAEDTAVLDALREPVQQPAPALTQREVEAAYATSGIWAVAPQVPPAPTSAVDLEDIYVASIDPLSTSNDAVALPSVGGFSTDLPLDKLAPPPAAGTTFALDAQGQVVPSVTGAPSPEGFTVYLGRPPVTPPATLARFAAVPQVDAIADSALAAFRPAPRPDNLAEQNERANLNGASLDELAKERPKLRPASVQEDAQAAAEKEKQQAAIDSDAAAQAALAQDEAAKPFATATQFAIKASVRPDVRPRNFARIVRRAKRTPAPQAQEETRVASRQVAPRVVTPRNPSKRSVARQATQKNAINLRKVNLIGVYGKPSSRRALVRLSNGRYKKVTVGDRVDGGRVSAISNSELRYTKGGRNVVLKMP